MTSATENLEFLKSMGFSEDLATNALKVTTTLETAIEWCLREQSSDGATNGDKQAQGESASASVTSEEDKEGVLSDDTKAQPEAKSLKCQVCGKLFSDIAGAEFHAAKTEHADFAESTEEKKALTAEERAAKVLDLQEKLKQRRLQREEEERVDSLQKEKTRRKEGKAVSSLKEQLRDEQMRKDIADRQREKQEEKLHRQQLLEQIKKDREERQNMRKVNATGGVTEDKVSQPVSTSDQPRSAPTAATAVNYDKCLLQIRLSNGEALQQEFSCAESLAAVRLYIEVNRTDGDGPFKIVNTSTFPRKTYTDDDMATPIRELNLAPRAVLAVSKVSPPPPQDF